jgi:cytochrome c oxidase assembly protein subunit 15
VIRVVRVLSWLTLATQILIVGTGGAVRLTGSGLGCPTWPTCTDESLIATPEMGIHGVIEFGNRLFSGVVGLVALALLVAVLIWLRRRDVLVPAVVIVVLTGLQALIGGRAVLGALDPGTVGVHFVISAVLVAVSAVVVYRVHNGRRGTLRVPSWFAAMVHLTSAVVAVTVVVGVLTTGSGPHAGDEASARNGLDTVLLQHIHSWPAYLTLALTVLLVILAFARHLPVVRWLIALLSVELVQVGVGLLQANTGLPPLLVGVHMVLACILVAVMTATVLAMRARAESARAAGDPARLR